MEDTPPDVSTIVWSRGLWRCEYRKTARGEEWLTLTYGPVTTLQRQVRGIDEMKDIAGLWQEATATLPPIPLANAPSGPERRHLPDRRSLPRGGRRAGDQQGI